MAVDPRAKGARTETTVRDLLKKNILKRLQIKILN